MNERIPKCPPLDIDDQQFGSSGWFPPDATVFAPDASPRGIVVSTSLAPDAAVFSPDAPSRGIGVVASMPSKVSVLDNGSHDQDTP